MDVRLLRFFLVATAFVLFVRWAGGQRAFRIVFGTMGFMLSRVSVLSVGFLGTVGMAFMLWSGMSEQGGDPLDALWLMGGLSLVCGFGLAALVVGPVWFALCLRRPKDVLELRRGEQVLREFPMNHFLGLESRGGVGYVTNLGLRFVPHRFVVQPGRWSIMFDEIERASVEGGRLLVLYGSDGEEHMLIAQSPHELANELVVFGDSAAYAA
ncbi:MAG: hypothetical protein AAF938_05240 [Myxococcota bacterium]